MKKTYQLKMSSQNQQIEMQQTNPVGTQILDSNLPSNLDFEEPQPKQISFQKPPSIPKVQNMADPSGSMNIKSYSVKGSSVFSLPPQYPIGSIAPSAIHTFPVHDLSEDQRTKGIWGIWESLVGFVKRQMIVDQGYIYLFSRQKEGLRCVGAWRLIDIFKIFVDLEEFELRLVLKVEGSTQLLTRDFQSGQLKNIFARTLEQMASIGLSLV